MDLTALNAALASLGPWGVLIGVALTFGGQWLRAKMKQPSGPGIDRPFSPPAPNPVPDPLVFPVSPDAAPSKRPLLDLLNLLLASRAVAVSETKRAELSAKLIEALHEHPEPVKLRE
jgi:hypothetical protein